MVAYTNVQGPVVVGGSLGGRAIRNFVDNFRRSRELSAGQHTRERHGGRAALLAWGTCALTLVLISASLAFAFLGTADVVGLNLPLVGVSGALVGGLVASRRPENPVGWFFLAGSLIGALQALAGAYAIYGLLVDPGSLPLAGMAAWFSKATQLVGPVFGFVLLPLYFPNGRPPSPFWRLVAWSALCLLPVATLISAFSPGEAVYSTGIENPLAIEAMRPLSDTLKPFIFVVYIGLMFAAAASLVVRLLRSKGEERQQIKWFVFAVSFVPVWFLVNAPVERAVPTLFQIVDALIIAGVPVAAGIAVLRYRLYDIDRIINRTIVYASLTTALVALYLVAIFVSQWVLIILTGQESTLAVVASTLVIAALFSPLRDRTQSFVDRRFYRRRYDAGKTLEAFAGKLRDETDLGTLNDELVWVVRETMQPEHVSLWLRPDPDPMDERQG